MEAIKAGVQVQKTTLLRKDGEEKRQEDNPTSYALHISLY